MDIGFFILPPSIENLLTAVWAGGGRAGSGVGGGGAIGGSGGRSPPADGRTAAAATAATSQQLSHLARALDHHAQGPNIPFGVNPSLR